MATTNKSKDDDASVFALLVSAFFFALLGAILGVVSVSMFKPLAFASVAERERIEAAPSDENRSPFGVFYYKGTDATGATWEAKREAFLAGEQKEVDLSVGELNIWMSNSFRPKGKQPEYEEIFKLRIVPGVPNFFIEGSDTVYASLPFKTSFLGRKGDYVAHVRGRFSDGPIAEFIVDRFYLNSAPIPMKAGIGGFVISQLLNSMSGSEEYLAIESAMLSVNTIEVDNERIRVTRR